jgi:hypothetical protein
MRRIKRVLVSGGAAVLLTGAALLGTATTASAAGLSCEQLDRQYDAAINDANYAHFLGNYYASVGQYWQAESFFAVERNIWININNIQLC